MKNNLTSNKDTYIWGAGYCGVLTALDLELKGVKAAGFIDRNAENIKTRLGLPVLTPSNLIKDNALVIVAVQNEKAIKDITDSLRLHGIDFMISRLTNSILDPDAKFQKELEIKNYFLTLNEEISDPDIFEIVSYFKKGYGFSTFPYEFSRKYHAEDIDVFWDNAYNAYHIEYEGKKLYFPEEWGVAQVRSYYNGIRIEQDKDSPHRYENEEFVVGEGDVIADVGTAEGIWALNNVEKAGKIYLFECEQKWIKALEKTFKPWEEKVVVTNKYVSNIDDTENVTLDSFFNGKQIDFIKADIEGMEIELLDGSKEILNNNRALKMLLCAYHKNGDGDKIKETLKKNGFKTGFSKGYMLFSLDKDLEQPYCRRGLVRAVKEYKCGKK